MPCMPLPGCESLQQQPGDQALGGSDAGATVSQGDSECGTAVQKGSIDRHMGICRRVTHELPGYNKGRAAYVFMSAGAPISWASKRVGNGSLSSCETEYMGLIFAAQESCYLQELKSEMFGVIGQKKVVRRIDLLTDSQFAKIDWRRIRCTMGGANISSPSGTSFDSEWERGSLSLSM